MRHPVFVFFFGFAFAILIGFALRYCSAFEGVRRSMSLRIPSIGGDFPIHSLFVYINSRAPRLRVLIFSCDSVKMSVLQKFGAGLLEMKTDPGAFALLPQIKYPLKIADARVRSAFAVIPDMRPSSFPRKSIFERQGSHIIRRCLSGSARNSPRRSSALA